jgi:hypothetical protein
LCFQQLSSVVLRRSVINALDKPERVLPVDAATADEWGRLDARGSLPVVDGLLAATARVHDLTLVTRNVKDVVRTGVDVLDPFTPTAL